MQDTAERDETLAGPRPAPTAPNGIRSLSGRLLIFTMLAVMLAEILLFVPSIARFRENWLTEKLERAVVASVASGEWDQNGAEEPARIDEARQGDLLEALGVRLVALSGAGAARLIARDPTLNEIDDTVAIDGESVLERVEQAFGVLFFGGGDRRLRVLGTVGEGPYRIEVVLDEADLRSDMLIYSRNIFFLSLFVALTVGLLLWWVIRGMLIRPIMRMTSSMIAFGERPADPSRVIAPTGRRDEIGLAEWELAAMQTRLAETLREQRHLADLGLAVSKINHDLRNILASAQMISDRLSTLPDPQVQRIAPMLLKSLDRALHYTQSVLAYGRAVEAAPNRRRVHLAEVVNDVHDLLAIDGGTTEIEFSNDVPDDLELSADPEQLHRLITNLCRNAVQALQSEDMKGVGVVRRLTIFAEQLTDETIRLVVADTGPGLPKKARENLFQAFRGSARSGGTGLGLAIAAEIVEAHGGTIALAEPDAPGTRFAIVLPVNGGPVTRAGTNAPADAPGA